MTLLNVAPGRPSRKTRSLSQHAESRLLRGLTGAVLLLITGATEATTCVNNVCNLEVFGTVTATSCDVDNASEHQTVDLGNVIIGAFKNTGDVSNPKAFHIKLAECSSNIGGGSITFQGTADTNNSDLLKLTSGTGAATGVGVQILDGASRTPIALGQATATHPLTEGDNELVYLLRYKSTLVPVTPGTANAVMYFDLSYQ